ncbi:MAG: glycosyltransferase [Chloroflexota bacterium]|nr:MAG: glycosyltransferase [Chloroflexota bacterium]
MKRQRPSPKLIFICHNVLPHESKRWDEWALRLALSSGDGFIAHSYANAEELAQYFPAAGIQVAPHPSYGALSTIEPAVVDFDLPDDRPLLLFIGFVRPYKGLDILLDAMPRILRSRSLHLLVAGEFWQGDQPYVNQIHRLGIGQAVTMENRYLPNEELSAVLARADVVVLPYRTATQSGIVQLAFGSQKPVITTDVGGLAEAVQDGQMGLVVPPEDPEALAAAVIRFFDEDLGPVFQEHIRRDSQRFSWQQMVRAITDLAEPGLDNEVSEPI